MQYFTHRTLQKVLHVCVYTVLSEALTPDDEVSDGGGRRPFWHVADGVESCMGPLHVTDDVGNQIHDVPFGYGVRKRRVFVPGILEGL